MSRFAHHVDLARLLSFWCSGQGFFISTTLVMYSGYALSLTLLVLAMNNLEGYFDTPGTMHDLKFSDDLKPNFGTRGGEEMFNAQCAAPPSNERRPMTPSATSMGTA